MVIIPAPLKSGARLAVVSPAGPVSAEEVERGRRALEAEGFKVFLMPAALDKNEYLAGDDSARANDLENAFLNPEFDAVICTRGGYGSMRLLERLDMDIIAAQRKPFVGFSDLTALQWALWKRKTFITFSGPQLVRGWGEGLSVYSRKSWLGMLAGRLWNKPLTLPEDQARLSQFHGGLTEGRLLGGNLAILASLCGTKDAPQFADAILLLEEIDEPLYRIDRMITQLRLSGAFEGVRGVVLGRFVQHAGGEANDQQEAVANIIMEALPGVPVAGDAPYGHTGDCWTVPLGSWAMLDSDEGVLMVEARG